MGGEAVDSRHVLYREAVADERYPRNRPLDDVDLAVTFPDLYLEVFRKLVAGQEGKAEFLVAVVGLVFFLALLLEAEEPCRAVGEVVGEYVQLKPLLQKRLVDVPDLVVLVLAGGAGEVELPALLGGGVEGAVEGEVDAEVLVVVDLGREERGHLVLLVVEEEGGEGAGGDPFIGTGGDHRQGDGDDLHLLPGSLVGEGIGEPVPGNHAGAGAQHQRDKEHGEKSDKSHRTFFRGGMKPRKYSGLSILFQPEKINLPRFSSYPQSRSPGSYTGPSSRCF